MISIRSLQHYLYCPRRWALIETDREWHENFFVIRADIAHEKVHSGEHGFSSRDKYVCSGVDLYNDLYDIYGVADCLEFVKSKNGSYIKFLDGNYIVNIVEYKIKRPPEGAVRDEDAVQVLAQKICVDGIYGCNSAAYIYYTAEKKREKIPFDDEIYKSSILVLFEKAVGDIKKLSGTGTIPQVSEGQKCSGCSFKDSCMPKVKGISFKKILKESNDEETS